MADEGDDGKTAEDRGEGGPRKFVFQCQQCGESCKRKHIPVHMADLARWVRDRTIERVIPFLQVGAADDELILELIKGEGGHCALYHSESGKCTIHYNKPVDCRAFPLGYDGDRYFVRYRDCPGLGKGDMTAEELAVMRGDAEASFTEAGEMASTLPVLQMLFLRKAMEESLKAVENLSEEDRKTLDSIMGKSRRRTGGGGDGEDVEEVEIKLDAEDTSSGDAGGGGKGEGGPKAEISGEAKKEGDEGEK